MNKTSKIYVAGHRGLVGSHILQALQEKGFTNLVYRTSSELDLTDQTATKAFFEKEKPEYVFLAAALVGGIGANNTYRADFIYNNLQVQNNVIKSSYDVGVKKLLFLGSSCIYPKNAHQPISENSLLTGDLEYTNEPYAIAKIAGIKLIESFNIQYGTNYLAVMPTNLYGRNDNFDLEKSHVLPALMRKMHLGALLEKGLLDEIAENLNLKTFEEIELLEQLEKYGITKNGTTVNISLWGSGKPYREFMHVTDMAEACVFIMENVDFKDLTSNMKEVKNTQINIGTGIDLTIKELAETVKRIVGFSGQLSFNPEQPDGTPRKLLDVSKLHKLGWKHKIELEEGIKDTYDWYKESVA